MSKVALLTSDIQGRIPIPPSSRGQFRPHRGAVLYPSYIARPPQLVASDTCVEDMQVFRDAILYQNVSCQDTSVFLYVSAIYPTFFRTLFVSYAAGRVQTRPRRSLSKLSQMCVRWPHPVFGRLS